MYEVVLTSGLVEFTGSFEECERIAKDRTDVLAIVQIDGDEDTV